MTSDLHARSGLNRACGDDSWMPGSALFPVSIAIRTSPSSSSEISTLGWVNYQIPRIGA
jgi:hypothetical protein